MSGTPDREKVIKGLEETYQHYSVVKGQGLLIDKRDGYELAWIDPELITDALALLKAQEARVMGVDEVREWVGKQRIDREPICVEVKDSICAWIVSDEYWDMQMDINLSSDLYGKTWRCWTSRPSAAEREATPWTQTNGL